MFITDRTVKIWDLQTRTEIRTLHGHPNNVVAVRYHPVTKMLLSASSHIVKIWDIRAPNVEFLSLLW